MIELKISINVEDNEFNIKNKAALDDVCLKMAKKINLNISIKPECASLFLINQILEMVYDKTNYDATIIFSVCEDSTLKEDILLSLRVSA